MAIIIFTVVFFAGMLTLFYMGFRKEAEGFSVDEDSNNLTYVDIPTGLPEPVKNYMQALHGSKLPVIETMIYFGTGRIKKYGIRMPFRFKTWSIPGSSFYREVEILWYGRPLFKGYESCQNGRGSVRYSGLVSTFRDGPKTDVSQFLIMWTETILAPSSWINATTVSWNSTGGMRNCQMTIPLRESFEQLSVTFNTETGMLAEMATLRYKGDGPRLPWKIIVDSWKPAKGTQLPVLSIAWGNEAGPSLKVAIEGIQYNADVSEYLESGPGSNDAKQMLMHG
jgi:hypothetical protein